MNGNILKIVDIVPVCLIYTTIFDWELFVLIFYIQPRMTMSILHGKTRI